MLEAPRSIGLPVDWRCVPDGELRRCRLPRHARLQASDDVEADSSLRGLRWHRANVTEHRERRPVVVGRDGQSAKSLGHHADDLEREPIDDQAATENGGVAREQPVPSAVTEDHDRLSRDGSSSAGVNARPIAALTRSTWKKLPVTNVPNIKRPSTRLSTWDTSA